MTAVIVQPCGSAVPQQHYNDTVLTPVEMSAYANLIPPADATILNTLFPQGSAAMWGVVPGQGAVNVSKYQRVQVGDLVMFSGNKRFFATGTVAHLMHNRALAEALWNHDDDGQTWEYMYALDEIRPLDVPYAEFNHAVGDSPNNNHMGFRVLDADKSDRLLAWLPLSSERHVPEVNAADYEVAARELSGDLDRKYQASRRTEQGYLRDLLFPTPMAECSLCGRVFEIEFLVAAHIKKRASCSDDERRDAEHVVMAACKFGCDELFERGYLSVAQGGGVLLSSALRPDSPASAYANTFLVGRRFPGELANRAAYFEWHRTHSFRG